jgi:hypothetical protein
MNFLNQKIILQAGSFGFIMGVLNTLGYTQKFELYIWIIIILGSSVIVAKKIDKKVFIHCLLIGLCWGVDTTFIESLFFNTYQNNNLYLNNVFIQTQWINPRILLILLGMFFGCFTGLILYFNQSVLRKLF